MLTHYFFLANFGWCFAVAFNFYQMIVRRNRESESLEKIYHGISWVCSAHRCPMSSADLAPGCAAHRGDRCRCHSQVRPSAHQQPDRNVRAALPLAAPLSASPQLLHHRSIPCLLLLPRAVPHRCRVQRRALLLREPRDPLHSGRRAQDGQQQELLEGVQGLPVHLLLDRSRLVLRLPRPARAQPQGTGRTFSTISAHTYTTHRAPGTQCQLIGDSIPRSAPRRCSPTD